MPKRCIMIFPKFDNIEVIKELRKKYDPLVDKVEPHITLVFPFESSFSTETLRKHIKEACYGIEPFEIRLKSICRGSGYGYYMFLNVMSGLDKLKLLHRRLYGGLLKEIYPKWLTVYNYVPHMTIGCFNDEETLEEALEEANGFEHTFNTAVEIISVEIIDENENSLIEIEQSLSFCKP